MSGDEAEDLEPPGANPRDGAIDFSQFSDGQLRDLKDTIDSRRFPQNLANLLAELRSREAADSASTNRFAVRFTAANGLLGWLQAKLDRQEFYGEGTIWVGVTEAGIQGWQRTWLGLPQQIETIVPLSSIRNAFQQEDWLEFEVKRGWWWSKRTSFRTKTVQVAAAIIALLPTQKSKWFEKQAQSVWDFHRLMRSSPRKPFITPAIIFVTVAIYVAMMIATRTLGNFDSATLVVWGANYGLLITDGQWWRLLTSIFLHLNLLHIAINMWVLWSVGRITEKLYGRTKFAALYFVAGLSGSLLSIAWNPEILSAGASGAIFGILGAFFAYLAHGGTRVPLAFMRAHLLPTALFVIFNITDGMMQPGIDNAAHVGGLLSGLLLGWTLARPLDRNDVRPALSMQTAATAFILAGGIIAVFAYAMDAVARPSPQDSYFKSHKWYVSGEGPNLALWQNLAARAQNGTVSNADISYQFSNNILPFWQEAVPRLRKEQADIPPDQRPFAAAVLEFAELHLRWAQALIESATTNDPVRAQETIDLMQKADLAQARIDRLSTRYAFDHRARSIASSSAIRFVENMFWYGHWKCVENSFREVNVVAPTDSQADGPARRAALRCQAQRLFLTGDFIALEILLNNAAARTGDLPDGSSSLEAAVGGLSSLFSFGGLGIQEALDRTALWRRTVPRSVESDLVEAEIFEAWGYAARGYGTADTISNQGIMLFLHRMEMAAAGLRAVAPRAENHPDWYEEAIYVGLYQSQDQQKLREIFDRGRSRFPNDLELDGAMMHALMPRWGGSFEKVREFIADQAGDPAINPKKSYEKYAQLYWLYSIDEGEDVNIFRDAEAAWGNMDAGLSFLMEDRPNSDYIRNAWGKFACIAGDRSEYEAFHSKLSHHYSASAWSNKISVASCDQKFSLR